MGKRVQYGGYGRVAKFLHKVINKKGEEIIPYKYNDIEDFSEGLAVVKNSDNKYGVIDKKGKIVIPIKYDYIDSFSEELARVKKNNKYGVINKKGEIIIPIKVGFINKINYKFFENGFYILEKLDNNLTLFDQNGNKIIIN